MPISNSYPRGIPIEDQDLFVGTKAANNRTVNYTAQGVADYLNINSKVAIGGQMSFQFTIVPNIPKTIAFEGGGGNNTAFSAITKLIVSAIDVSTANITIFLNYLNNSQVLLSQQNQPNFFGHYKITGYTQIGTSAFYELDLEFIGGNGTIIDKQYYDLVSFVLSAETSPTEWGDITGDIEDQTDLINYISSQVTTPTLQEVTDEGNETTNNIIVDGGLFKTLITPNEVQVAIVDGINFDRINLGFNGLTRQTSTDNSGIITTQDLEFEGILTDEILTIPNKTGILATLDDITIPTLQEVTDQVGGNITTNAITLTNDTIPLNLGYNGYDVLTFTDNGVDASLGFYGLAFNAGTFASGLSPTSVEFYQNNKQTYYQAANILFRDLVTYKDLNINYPTSIVGTNKIQTFQDADGTIALLSDITTPTLQEVTDAGNATINTIEVAGITSGNFTSDGDLIFGVSDNLDGFNNFKYTPGVGLYVDDGVGSYVSLNYPANIQFSTPSGSAVLSSNLLTAARNLELPNGSGTIPLTVNGQSANSSGAITIPVGTGTVTSVGLTMPSAFTVTNSPITSSGDIAVTGAGLVSQYVRGDGTLANFPNSTGGGSSVNYYLNGSVSQGTFGGDTYYQLSKTPILGAGTNFTRTNGAGNGYIASFITDAGDPSQLNIPGGNWNVEFYFNASSGGGSPSFYAELYKVSATNVFTLIASDSLNPEGITNGTVVDQYFTSIPVPQTTLLVTDRLAVRIFVNTGGRTITLHTENGNLSEVLTTFTTGLTALNGLTDQVQFFDVGTGATNFNISSSGDTHTFNLLFNIRRNANNSSNNNINYNGYAVTGSAESSAVWTITRLTIAASGSVTTATATNVAWTDRETTIYT
jgi:hypothetical protein